MTATTIRVQMAQRKDTAANWTAANPILLSGEIGHETDTKKFKIGDGTTNWNSLAYLPIPDGSGNLTITGNLEIGTTGSLTFEGSTANGFETTLAVTDPTADRTITLPNVSGTVITTGDTGSVTSTMIADGTIVNADISGSAEIAVSKLANGTANQVIVTDGTNVSWSDNLTLAGDLTVNGTTTTINTQDLLVEDKNIIIGNVATPSDVTADGGGITLKGATDKTINWVDATDAWTSSERFSYPLGSATTPSLTFTGDTNTGIYSPGADQVAISTNGTGRLFVDASWNVGVGTSSPAPAIGNGATLHLYGASTTSELRLQRGNGTDLSLLAGSATGGASISLNNKFSISTDSNSTQAFTVDTSGRVGIGTSSPGGPLSVAFTNATVYSATTAANNALAAINSSATTGSFASVSLSSRNTANAGCTVNLLGISTSTNNASDFAIQQRTTSGAYRENLRITHDGKVGIGTTSPEVACDISGQVRASTGVLFGTDTAAANALDDYEEGTFTPTIVGTSTAGTATYAANGQVGRYTKIGNRVFFDLFLSWTAHTGTGDLQINGLPFTVQNTTNMNRNYSAIFSSVALTAGSIGAAFSSPNTTAVALRQMPTGGGSVATIPMDTSAQISISGCFDA